MRRSVLILCLTALVAGCGDTFDPPSPTRPDEVRLIPTQLDIRAAESDAMQAIARGDRHLLGVYGIAAATPGLPGETPPADWDGEVLYIAGTSDTPAEGAELDFNDKATAYAAAYNRVIVRETANSPRS